MKKKKKLMWAIEDFHKYLKKNSAELGCSMFDVQEVLIDHKLSKKDIEIRKDRKKMGIEIVY